MSDDVGFHLSRIYAKGWLAGMSSDVDDADADIDSAAAALNPFVAADESARWILGFKEAIVRKLGRSAKKPARKR